MKKLLTAAPIITKRPEFIPTGNLLVSIPEISRRDGGIYRFGILREDANSLIDIIGDESKQSGFLTPFFRKDNAPIHLTPRVWERLDDWIPSYSTYSDDLSIRGTIFTPQGLSGYVYQVEISTCSPSGIDLTVGFTGVWNGVEQVVFSNRPLNTYLDIWQDPWTGSLVGEARDGFPIVAWGMQPDQEGRWLLEKYQYTWQKELRVTSDHPVKIAMHVAVNLERDGARTSALHLRRVGSDQLLAETRSWLQTHRQNPDNQMLKRKLNENLFFNYFYAQGECLDSGNLVLLTSRSRQYYVCSAFWARDAYLWSFPALLLVDKIQARKALLAGLGRYHAVAGEHALYLNGRQLYPGFELDEACAGLIALGMYVEETGDIDILSTAEVRQAVDSWDAAICGRYQQVIGLYSTFLTPHDDPTDYPYLTYNNVLVWKTLSIAANLVQRNNPNDPRLSFWQARADQLQLAIHTRLTRKGPYGQQYVGAVDLQGNVDWIDFPGGSMSLLPYYGFCETDDATYQNTIQWIYSPDNPYYYTNCCFPGVGSVHFPYPSSFDLANRLIYGQNEAQMEAAEVTMDYGLACESFDPQTGEVTTGAAFATGAGFLAHAIHRSLNN